MTITIEIDDNTFNAIAEHISGLRKPPRQLENGAVISEPLFSGPEQYIEEVLAQNFVRILEANPTPEMIQARLQLEAAQRAMLAAAKPAVRSDRTLLNKEREVEK